MTVTPFQKLLVRLLVAILEQVRLGNLRWLRDEVREEQARVLSDAYRFLELPEPGGIGQSESENR